MEAVSRHAAEQADGALHADRVVARIVAVHQEVDEPRLRATTILSVRRGDQVVVIGDGQVSLAEFKAALLTPQAMPPALKGLISVGEVVMSRLGAVGGGLSSVQQAAGPSALANWTNATALGAAGSAVTSGWSAVSSAGASAASSIGSLLAWRPRGADADA